MREIEIEREKEREIERERERERGTKRDKKHDIKWDKIKGLAKKSLPKINPQIYRDLLMHI